jgi:ABC-type transport system involved in multi-copper enzyme maturation permease subunit
MEFPVLALELVLRLRRPWLFLALGVVFLSLTFLASVFARPVLLDIHREDVCRSIFYGLLFVAYLGFTFHACRVAAQSTGKERDRGTSVFLRTAPLRGWSVVLQKMGMALTIEWFVFIGLLPFVSLLFLIGGVGGWEFVYQLVCLFVWINTCVMLGLVAGLSARNSAAAERFALGYILLVGLAPNVALLPGLGRRFSTGPLLQAIWDGLSEGLHFLITLSPLYMTESWSLSSADLDLFWTAAWLNPNCLALLSWTLHLSLQIVLYILAIHLWNRVGEDSVRPENLGRTRTSNPRCRYGEGWRAFLRQERSQSRIQGRRSRIFLTLCLLAGFVAGTYATGVELPVVTTCFVLFSFLATLFFSQSAFGREIKRGTAPLLLVSPATLGEIALGKWFYYQLLGLTILLPGIAFTAALIFRAEYYSLPNAGEYWRYLSYYLIAAAALPMGAMLGIVLGLNTFPIYYALPLGIGAVCLAPVTILAFLAWIFQQLMASETNREEQVTLSQRHNKLLLTAMAVFALFAVVAGFSMGWGPDDPSFKSAIGVTLTILNAAVVLPAIGTSLWIWLSNRPEDWWKQKLLSSEAPYDSIGRNDPFFAGQAKRYSRYKARILAIAARPPGSRSAT